MKVYYLRVKICPVAVTFLHPTVSSVFTVDYDINKWRNGMGPNAIGDAARNGFNEFVAFLPELVGAIVILLIGWLAARALAHLAVTGLRATQFDEVLLNSHAGGVVERMIGDPSQFVGKVVY